MIDLTNDHQVLAATIWAEARNQTALGKKAVACVVMNRARVAAATGRKQFGDGTAKGACLAPWQFSCWNHNDPQRDRLLTLDFSAANTVLDYCADVALEALDGHLVDPTKQSLYYKRTDLPWPHDWGVEVPPNVVIGAHSFYNLKE